MNWLNHQVQIVSVLPETPQRSHATDTLTCLPRVIVFDLDGTLLDTMEIFATVAADLLQRHCGIPYSRGRELYLETSGLPFAQQLECISSGHPQRRNIVAAFEQRKRQAARGVTLPGRSLQALVHLVDRGFRLAVSSNNSQASVSAFAEKTHGLFELALGKTDTLSKGRAHLAVLERHFVCQAQQMLFIGDSLADGRLASQCGIPFVGLGTTTPAHRFHAEGWTHIQTLEELAEQLTGEVIAAHGKAL